MNNSQNFGLVQVIHSNVDMATGLEVNEVSINISSRGSMNLEEAQEHLDNLQAAIDHANSIV
jgi:uncharacterized membrane protein YjjP (DUF1212 family)